MVSFEEGDGEEKGGLWVVLCLVIYCDGCMLMLIQYTNIYYAWVAPN